MNPSAPTLALLDHPSSTSPPSCAGAVEIAGNIGQTGVACSDKAVLTRGPQSNGSGGLDLHCSSSR